MIRITVTHAIVKGISNNFFYQWLKNEISLFRYKKYWFDLITNFKIKWSLKKLL